MKLLRSHGITRDPARMHFLDGPWYYEQIELGFNYRMTDIQAALGISQLQRLDEYVFKRHEIALQYRERLDKLPIKMPLFDDICKSALHLFPIQVCGNRSRLEIFNLLRKHLIFVNVHYIPIYLQPDYRKLGFDVGYCKNAEAYYERAISLPIFPGLTCAQQGEIINVLHNVIE